MKYAPSGQRSEYVIKDIVEFEQTDLKIKLAEFDRRAQNSRQQKRRPERAFSAECIRQDKAKREKQNDIVNNLHAKLHASSENPSLIRPEQFQLISMRGARFSKQDRKVYDCANLNSKTDKRCRPPHLSQEPNIQPMHEQNIHKNKYRQKSQQIPVLNNINFQKNQVRPNHHCQ